MDALNGPILSEGLLEALVAVAEQGLGALTSEARVRQAGVTLGTILARQAALPDSNAEAGRPVGRTPYGRLARQVLEQLAPGSRVLDDTTDRLVICMPPGEVEAAPPPRDRLVAAALGSLAAHQAGLATVRTELRIVDGETCWVVTVRLAPTDERAPGEEEYCPTPFGAGAYAEPAQQALADEREDRVRRLGEMAAGVAHGLNNLLGAVAGQSSQLLGDTGGGQPSSGLRLIHQAALDGAGLARRLLRVSRGEASDEDDALTLVDLRDVVADAVALTRTRWHDEATRRGVTVDLHVETPEPLPISGVPADLREIVINLILNAVDAMPAGGTVLLRGEEQDQRVILTCQDSGIGMPPAVLERIFEPFFSTKGSSGTGMGLAILYGVVARHGGEVHVASTVGAGTTFTVALPKPVLASVSTVADRLGLATIDQPSAEDEAAAALAGLALLLVDDDPAFRAVFARRLALDAERVDAVADASAALTALEAQTWDVLCVDDRLPDMTGRELAGEIRRRGLACAIVLVSGFATRPNDPALLAPGVDGVLPKPCTDAELARVFRQVRPNHPSPR